MYDFSFFSKHVCQSSNLSAMEEEAWQKLLDSQEARLLKNQSSFELYDLFVQERITLRKFFEEMKSDLHSRQQREREELARIDELRNLDNGK